MAETQPPVNTLDLTVDGQSLPVPPDTTIEGPRKVDEGLEIVLRYGKRDDHDVDFAMDLADQVVSGKKILLTIRPRDSAAPPRPSVSAGRPDAKPPVQYRLLATRNIKLQTEDEEAMADSGEPPRGISFGPECEVLQHFLVEPA